MATTEAATRRMYAELEPGDRVRVVHEIKVGMKVWNTTTEGEVVRKERRRHGLHFRRNGDDKVFSDSLVLKRESGELTTLTIDEFTELERI